MAYQVGSTCYGSAASALSAAASENTGAVVTHGGAAYVVGVQSVTGSSITYQLSPVGGGTPITSVANMTPQPCGLLTAADANLIGWGIAAAWIAVAAIMALRKGAHE